MDGTAVEKDALAASGRRRALALPEVLKRVWLPFLLSRLIVFILFAVTPIIAAVPIAQWNSDDGTAVRLSRAAMADGISRVAIGNDSGWYLGIARDGYEKRPFDTSRQANWAFFPLHPMLWRAAAAVTGEWTWSGVIIANGLFLGALCALWQLALELTERRETADAAVTFASVWPTTYFMSLPHTEALFFLLAGLSLLAGTRRKFGTAGVFGALASATRFNGLFLIPALGMAWLRSERRRRDLAWIGVATAGALLYAGYLGSITGNPLAFKDIQVTWGRHVAAPWTALADYIGHPAKLAVSWNPRALNFLVAIAGIASIVTCWRKGWRDLAMFTGLTLLAPLCTGTLTSLTRYAGVAPGVFLALAVWSEDKPRVAQVLTMLSSVALAFMVILFALGINMAGA